MKAFIKRYWIFLLCILVQLFLIGFQIWNQSGFFHISFAVANTLICIFILRSRYLSDQLYKE